ncbi:amylo-alpha-1,6-glucosidase [Micromonospora sp. M12]
MVRTDQAAVDVVAGYPWFGAWSRDTMISYEGCSSAPVAPTRAELLRAYAATLSEGCSPTRPTPVGWSTTPSTARCGSCTR